MADLTGKIILVTGAAGAIGAAVTAAVKRAGGTAIASDLSSATSMRSMSRPNPIGSGRRRDRAKGTAGWTGW